MKLLIEVDIAEYEKKVSYLKMIPMCEPNLNPLEQCRVLQKNKLGRACLAVDNDCTSPP